MAGTIRNLRKMQRMGILSDRSGNSPSIGFQRYNLIYGFNGSGKSTLSRLFASLEAGELHSKLPEDASFEVELDDGTIFGCPEKPSGLEQRVLVFNSDFIDHNLQWVEGRARPVFFIGADQAEAAGRLSRLEQKIDELITRNMHADAEEKSADKALAAFKRDRAKMTALRLHQGNRKYEAPQLMSDYNAWSADTATSLDDNQLRAAEDVRKLSEPMPSVALVSFESASVSRAFEFVRVACEQTLSEVTLDEAQKYPDILLWLKSGHEFHILHELDKCLLCGGQLSAERKKKLSTALDNKIDEFVAKLARTSERLGAILESLTGIETGAPYPDALATELRIAYGESRRDLVHSVQATRHALTSLNSVLMEKQERPASAADTSRLLAAEDVEEMAKTLANALQAANIILAKHNALVEDFAKHRDEAGLAIRKHFIAECRDEFAVKLLEAERTKKALEQAKTELADTRAQADQLRRLIRTHGPAADAINKLIASYLGHKELSIAAVDQGYEIHRHGRAIKGLPSEGEKTAIAISYFLSTIESDGRRIKDLIVIVDDPISSLDSKALNYACSLVRNRLETASQVFILTHNQQCMNEFKKSWRNKVKPPEGKEPSAHFLYLNVTSQVGSARRESSLVRMSTLLREYDSEYHFLFEHVLRFSEAGNVHSDHGYMMPNILRRVLDIFLAFKCPGSSGLPGKIDALCKAYPDLDRDRLSALERLSQVESHSDNLDDLISFSSMTIEEAHDAAEALLEMMHHVDEGHLKGVKRICERARAS